MDENKGHEQKKDDGLPKVQYVLIIALVGLMAFNQLQMANLQNANSDHYSRMVLMASQIQQQGVASQSISQSANGAQQTSQQIQTAASGPAPIDLQAIANKVIPRGIPAVYGTELKVNFDDPINSMNVLAKLDDGNGMADPAMNARYVKIGSQIACEYCCGATALVSGSGSAACGCAHSYAMRGLAKYIISKHGSEFTDDQILLELGKWKTMFFPKQILTKAVEFASAGKDINTADLTSNKYRGFVAPAQPAQSGPAGGAATDLNGLPNMVGGC
ncbi:hypothetical protein HY989_05400 [Candidatus Micrarchaeota archaeon]|nr:hypothetical protein [Candidatus Micrarchaeota archaeon]